MTAKPKDSISFKWPKPTPTKQDAKPRNHDEDESESFCESSPFGRMTFLHGGLFIPFRSPTKNPSKRSPLFRPHFFFDFWMVQKLLQMTYKSLFIGVALGVFFTGRNPWCSMGFSLGRKLHQMSTEAAKNHPTIHRIRTINMEDRPKKSIFIS